MLTKFTVVAAAIASVALVGATAEAPTGFALDDVLANSTSVRELRAEANDGCWRVGMHVDLTGNDVGYLRAKDPNPCITHCSKTGACDMFTHTDYDGGRCWLKKSNGRINGKVNSGAVSLIYSKPCKQTNVFLGKCEMTDKNRDVGAQKAPASACSGICSKMEMCLAFTWTNYNGGTCWLKSYVSECKPSATGESWAVPY